MKSLETGRSEADDSFGRQIKMTDTQENLLKANYPDIGFVNIYNILADKNGNLLSVFAAADGCHLKPIAYTRILSYMAYGK